MMILANVRQGISMALKVFIQQSGDITLDPDLVGRVYVHNNRYDCDGFAASVTLYGVITDKGKKWRFEDIDIDDLIKIVHIIDDYEDFFVHKSEK